MADKQKTPAELAAFDEAARRWAKIQHEEQRRDAEKEAWENIGKLSPHALDQLVQPVFAQHERDRQAREAQERKRIDEEAARRRSAARGDM